MRTAKRVFPLLWLCMLVLMLAFLPAAFAAFGPSRTDLEEINSQIEYPKNDEYWDNYAYGTVVAPKGHSVYCYGSADRKGSQYTVLDGEEVTILASRGDMLCVIIPSQNRGRWIKEEHVDIYQGGENRTSQHITIEIRSGSPGKKDLEEINSQIEYPKSGEYWDNYGYGFVAAPKGHSVYCYGSADRQGSQYTVLDGEEVVVLASRGDMLCVIIPSQNRGRWIKEEHVDLY